MKIEYLARHSDDPNTFLYLERYINADSRTYSPFAHQSEGDLKYHPAGDTESFEVPCLEIPKEKITIYLNKPNSQLLNHYIRKETVLFPIHPETFADDTIPVIKELRRYPSANEVEVMSGFHKVVIVTWVHEKSYNIFSLPFARSFTDYYTLEFAAEAGHQYKIKTVDFLSFFQYKVPVPGSPLIAVVDIHSGAVVTRQPIDQHRLFSSK